MDNKHTELPWRVSQGHFIDSRVQGGLYQEVAWCGDCEYGDRNSNARLIVTAVNYHQKLRDALRNLEMWAPKDMAEAEEARDLLCELDYMEEANENRS